MSEKGGGGEVVGNGGAVVGGRAGMGEIMSKLNELRVSIFETVSSNFWRL